MLDHGLILSQHVHFVLILALAQAEEIVLLVFFNWLLWVHLLLYGHLSIRVIDRDSLLLS